MHKCRHCGGEIFPAADGSYSAYCQKCNPYSVSVGNQQFRHLTLWKEDENGEMKLGKVDANGDFIFLEDDERMSGKTVAELLHLEEDKE